MFATHEFKGFIGIFENYFQGSYIDDLIKYYNKVNSFPLIPKDAPRHWKDDNQLYMFDPVVIHDLNPHFATYFFETVWEKIIPIYLDKFSILQDVPLCADQLKLKKIPVGGGFHQWHYESLGNDSRRRLVVQLYLNDIDEAGETEFLYQNTRITPKKNRLLVWPSDWTFTHRGNPPIGNKEKYILTTWIKETEFEKGATK